MSQDDPKQSLADKIRRMLAREFEQLSPDAVAGVLANLASELVMLSEAGLSSMSDVEQNDWHKPEHPFDVRVAKDGTIDVECNAPDPTHEIMNQVLNVGAVMLQLATAPPLNSAVRVRFNFPKHHVDLVVAGRVVHVSPKGTAVELGQLAGEDRAALEAVWPDVLAAIRPPSGIPEVAPARPRNEAGGTVQTAMPIRATDAAARTQQFRRRIDLTDPDVKVITSSTQFGLQTVGTREFYGPELARIHPTHEPDRAERLADDRVVDVLLQISQSNLTGIVELDDLKGVTRQLFFDGGFVVEVSRSPRSADEELGLMLLRADRITRQQLAMAAAHADENNVSIERALLELDILDPEAIRHAIAGRLTFLLRDIASWRSGELKVFGANGLPTGFLPAPPLRVHVATERVIFRKLFESLRNVSLKDRETQMEGYLDAYPEILADERERVERTLTEAEHRQLVETVVNGRRRLREVFTESALPHADTYAVVHTLHRMGLLRFDRSLHQTVVRERFRENVTVKYLSVHKASYFEVLNVHWSSYDDAVRKAYEELVVQFDPASVPEHLESEVHQRVLEIRERVESAYQVLASRDPRHAYRKRIMPDYKLAHAIPLFLKQAELAEKRRQWAESLDAIKRVLELEPSHKEARFKAQRLQDIIDNRLSPDAEDSNF